MHFCFILQSYSTFKTKGLQHRRFQRPSVSFTPHLAFSVMKDDKRGDKDRSISDRGPTRLNKCYTIHLLQITNLSHLECDKLVNTGA